MDVSSAICGCAGRPCRRPREGRAGLAAYFGLTLGSPPGVPGGGITGILAESSGGLFCIPGSTFSGGLITPPDWFSRSLRLPDGAASVDGGLAPSAADPGGSAA